MRPLLVAALLLALPLTAVADDHAGDVHKMNTDDCARARKLNKTCVLSIEDETVEGNTPTFTESSITVNMFRGHGSLIRVRKDFIPEILKSAEDL